MNTLCILHGYLLEGSGSNLWTRSVVRALCRAGRTVHLVCQENHPDRYDFIAEAHIHDHDGSVDTTLERDVPYPGRCILHRPVLSDTLPVYVWDRYEEFTRVVPMIELSDVELEDYIGRNEEVVSRIVAARGITSILANHAVLMSVVARRVSAATSVPYSIMPHGSAIEYAVKKDPRLFRLAEDTFRAAGRIFVIGDEIRTRVVDVFPDVPALEPKMVPLNLGVDTTLFDTVPRGDRPKRIGSLVQALADLPRGRPRTMTDTLCADLDKAPSLESLSHFDGDVQYSDKNPDEGVEDRLGALDWESDRILLFVGRLIKGKGPHLALAALPLLLGDRPDTRLIMVGHGPLRERLEAFLWILEHGNREALEGCRKWGEPFEDLAPFFSGLEEQGRLDDYVDAARRHVRRDRVVFTGYLAHPLLRFLFPCCDVGLFPSVVAEAGPLVFLEALASGCFPLGVYFAGMGASIDAVSAVLPDEVAALMKLGRKPVETINDIATGVRGALSLEGRHREALRELAVTDYDWSNVARRLLENMDRLSLVD